MCCSKCKKDKKIVNKHFGLCQECNNERLHGNPFGKKYDYQSKSSKLPRRTKSNTRKSRESLFKPIDKGRKKTKKDKISDDELFYEECFNNSEHKCEECGKDLPTIFRDDEGKVVARWRYSHIVPKSIAPELRHKIININHLCLKDHQEWENGDKESMKIYEKNKARLPQFF